jgi:hypothetical protein
MTAFIILTLIAIPVGPIIATLGFLLRRLPFKVQLYQQHDHLSFVRNNLFLLAVRGLGDFLVEKLDRRRVHSEDGYGHLAVGTQR